MKMFSGCLKSNEYGSTASVVDGKLILSFPQAVRPVLWQMDLGAVKTSALEMVEGAESGQFGLALRAPKGDVQEIVLFSTREQALEALVIVRDALARAHGQIRPLAPILADGSGGVPVGGGYASSPGGWQGARADAHQTAMKWIGGLAGLVVLAILLNMLWSLSPRPPASIPSASASGGAGQDSPQEKTGEPVSADDFLRSQP
ncbi:MAG TPA: hypothetical protein PKX87_07865 [Alphaproteobacteria bacterium]|nr:hypothetical protein [Alphaproteobacteria bacterium]